MTPVERLQAAIKKLEQMRVYSASNGAWESCDFTTGEHHGYDAEIRHNDMPEGVFDGVALVYDSADAELIATLHRTIDAQLAILNRAVIKVADWTNPNGEYGYEPETDGDGSSVVTRELALADAILGGTE